MDEKFTRLEEKTAILQAEMSEMSDELYAQQKEIAELRRDVETLRSRLKAAQTDSGILRADEDVPPPHY